MSDENKMNEIREFPTPVIASISSGIMLCDSFSLIHEAAEYLMGHPIWTHHFADKRLNEDMCRMVLEQCPGMPNHGDITSANWREKLAALLADLGQTVTIRKGSGLTALLPTDGIPNDRPVVILCLARDGGK